MLVLASDVYIGQAIVVYGEYCPAEARLLQQLIRPGMTVVEIGANMGSHSVDMARACAPGPFYAFEPQPRLFQILCANLALNDVDNALAYPEACGAEEGEAMIPRIDYAQRGNFGGVSLGDATDAGIVVRVRPIDALDLPACGLLKIDVEGFEAQVVLGARETIRRCRPVIYIENDRAAKQQELISLIAGLDYRLYWHTPALYDPANFRGVRENIYPNLVSVNMLCLPREAGAIVADASEIDPANWSSPI